MYFQTPVSVAVASCLAVVIVSGCASKPVVVDNTPLVKTATVTTNIRNNGFKGFLASDGEQVIRTVANMRRTDENFRFTGGIMSRIGGKQNQSEIIRLDKNLEWRLDNRKKRYTECALDGCGKLASFDLDTYTSSIGAQGNDTSEENSCQLSITENDFSIVKTGQSREINGFPAEEFVMEWAITATDDDGASSTNLLSSTTWTTPITGNVAEALQMTETFDVAYRASLDNAYPDQFGDVLPEDAMAFVTQYLLDNMPEQEIAQLKAVIGNQVEVTGYPVSQKVQWDMSGSTCAEPQEPEQESSSRLDVSSFGGLLESVGKRLVDQEIDRRKEAKLAEIALEPVFSLVTEVKSIEIGEIRESQLSVPANYKLDNRS